MASGAPGPPEKSAFWSCLSCRLLSGAALLGSGVWVYLGPRRLMQQRIPPNPGNIAQMTFAFGLICWGIVVIIDPVGRLKKDEK
ncbi:distal membrane-arm assembly complex protein 1 isoform X2 [Sceloporus undulatus]|uniref:distal membrane-arm assembly complex protein 1 isoform X2 n=1 Tax=Sceloporus undulatus TaxID=8520 RepID=UPI001C4BDB04|nr:distal membrane-arm assembly complex protein 1 isoform X2 [Sceloporus undulatus]